MRSTSVSFRQNSVEALLDPDLQKALGKMGFLGARHGRHHKRRARGTQQPAPGKSVACHGGLLPDCLSPQG